METPLARLRARLEKAGYGFVEPPVLHDADLFLDLAGEDLRRRMFLTGSADGIELCLRPDYTIPVALHHLTSGNPTRPGAYAYCGPVFRQRSGETGEFAQAGVESIGRADRMDADADVLALALECAALLGLSAPTIRIGDSGLFAALVDALPLPDVWRRRIGRAFGNGPLLRQLIDELAGRSSRPRVEALALHGSLQFDAEPDALTAQAVRDQVQTHFRAAGIPEFGGRTIAEIADRFIEQVTLTIESPATHEAAEVMTRFLAIAGAPDRAALELGRLAATEAPGLAIAVEHFAQRTERLIGHSIDPARLAFAADFGRRLDYYTGFVFELGDPARSDGRPVAGGGRYDRLLSLIRSRNGTGTEVPAVGFALYLDRFEGPLA